jgi:hypothetical protein
MNVFSKKLNVILVMEPVENLGKHEHEEAVRLAGIKAAHYLGLAGTAAPSFSETRYEVPTRLELEAKYPSLPILPTFDRVPPAPPAVLAPRRKGPRAWKTIRSSILSSCGQS